MGIFYCNAGDHHGNLRLRFHALSGTGDCGSRLAFFPESLTDSDRLDIRKHGFRSCITYLSFSRCLASDRS
jgi:hypothetical protein